MRYTAYLVLSRQMGITRLTKTTPNLESYERAVRLDLDIPVEFWDGGPRISATLPVPQQEIQGAVTGFDAYELLAENLAPKTVK